jgi:hypothetical protein
MNYIAVDVEVGGRRKYVVVVGLLQGLRSVTAMRREKCYEFVPKFGYLSSSFAA